MKKKLIARGGEGVVYKVNIGQATVAYKRNKYCFGDDMHSVQHEYAILVSIQHPNIVSVIKINAKGDGIYMPYYPITLKHLIEKLDYPDSTALSISIDLFSALAFLHGENIFHRDLKPANILLYQPVQNEHHQWVPKLADFGLARYADGTLERDILYVDIKPGSGTPAFSAPEALTSNNSRLTDWADVYSLVLVMLAMLLRKIPYKGWMAQHIIMSKTLFNSDYDLADALMLKSDDDFTRIIASTIKADQPEKRPSASSMMRGLVRYRNQLLKQSLLDQTNKQQLPTVTSP